jgi:hypothetical protein
VNPDAEKKDASRTCKGWSGREGKNGLNWTQTHLARLDRTSFSTMWGDLADEGKLDVYTTDGEVFRGRWSWRTREGIAEFVLYRSSRGVAFIGRWMDGRGRQGRWFLLLDFEEE